MSAPSLSIQQTYKTVRKKTAKKGTNLKTVLYSPSVMTWPTVHKEIAEEVLKKLDRVLQESHSAFSKSSAYLEMTKKKLMKRKHRIKLSKAEKCAMKAQRLETLQTAKQEASSLEDRNLKSQVVLGVQNVTKHLERDMLRLVLVDREVQPLLHQHLPALSAVRKCPAAAIRGLADRLCPRFSISSLVAVGFKKLTDGDCDKFNSVVEFIVGKLPPILNTAHGPEAAMPLDSALVSSTLHDSGTAFKESSKPQTDGETASKESSKAQTAVTNEISAQQSLYVMKSQTSNSLCLEEDEIEDVTSDQEEHGWTPAPALHKPEVPEGKKRKRQCDADPKAEKKKKQKQSGFVAAKLGRMQSNVNRKRTKKKKK